MISGNARSVHQADAGDKRGDFQQSQEKKHRHWREPDLIYRHAPIRAIHRH